MVEQVEEAVEPEVTEAKDSKADAAALEQVEALQKAYRQSRGEETDEADEEVADGLPDDADASDDEPLSKDLIRAGQYWGYTDDELRLMSAAKQAKLVETMKTRDSEFSQQKRTREAPPRDDTGRFTKRAEAEPEKDDEEFTPIDLSVFEADLYDDDVAAPLKSMGAMVNKLIERDKRLRSDLDQFQRYKDEQLTREADKHVSAWFEDLDRAGKARYGEGAVSYDDDTPEAKARVELLEEATTLLDAARARGRSMTIEQAMDRAHVVLGGGVSQKASEKAQKRTAGRLLPPGSSGSRSDAANRLTPDERAIEVVRTIQRQYRG